jgi:fucose permease
VVYKVYKRRFFGLAQLALLNIMISWGWIVFAPISDISAEYFHTSESNINWLSTAFFWAYVVATPPTFYTLHKHGPKVSIIVAAVLTLLGSWIKYGATRAGNFAGLMVGQLIIGFAQPFVLSAPTSYSNLWFSPAGRTTATAVTSLANPFGAALGQLISPFWATKPSHIPNTLLYVAIISSVASIPALFIPSAPPTPPSAGSTSSSSKPSNGATTTGTTTTNRTTLTHDLRTLFHSPEFFLIFIPFSIYVGLFNAISTLLNQILEPYSFSSDDAGIAGAVLIVVGLVSAAITTPFMDKYKFYLPYIKLSTPVIALSYLIFLFSPATKSLAFVYVMCALLGACSFGLVPVVLEFLVEIHYPLGPEVGSSLCWCGGQLLGGVFVVIMDALKAGDNASPPRNMKRALVFQAVLAMVAMPAVLVLGLFGRQGKVRRLRWEADRNGGTEGDVQVIDGGEDEEEQEVEVGRRISPL